MTKEDDTPPDLPGPGESRGSHPSEQTTDDDFDSWLRWYTAILDDAALSGHPVPEPDRSLARARIRRELERFQLTPRQTDILFGRYYDSSLNVRPGEWDQLVARLVDRDFGDPGGLTGPTLTVLCITERAVLDHEALLPKYQKLFPDLHRLTRNIQHIQEEWNT